MKRVLWQGTRTVPCPRRITRVHKLSSSSYVYLELLLLSKNIEVNVESITEYTSNNWCRVQFDTTDLDFRNTPLSRVYQVAIFVVVSSCCVVAFGLAVIAIVVFAITVAVLAVAFVALLLAFAAVVAVTAIVVLVRFVARIVLSTRRGSREHVRSAPALSRLAPMESTPAENTRARARPSRTESSSSIEELGDTTIVTRAQTHAEPARAAESPEVDRTLAILPRATPPPAHRAIVRAPARTEVPNPAHVDAGTDALLAAFPTTASDSRRSTRRRAPQKSELIVQP